MADDTHIFEASENPSQYGSCKICEEAWNHPNHDVLKNLDPASDLNDTIAMIKTLETEVQLLRKEVTEFFNQVQRLQTAALLHDANQSREIRSQNEMYDKLYSAFIDLYHTFLDRHGSFPLDETNDRERLWKHVMSQSHEILGNDADPISWDAKRTMERALEKLNES